MRCSRCMRCARGIPPPAAGASGACSAEGIPRPADLLGLLGHETAEEPCTALHGFALLCLCAWAADTTMLWPNGAPEGLSLGCGLIHRC